MCDGLFEVSYFRDPAVLFSVFCWLNAKPEVLMQVFFPSHLNVQEASCSPVAEAALSLSSVLEAGVQMKNDHKSSHLEIAPLTVQS